MKPSILVVDDDKNIRSFLKEGLSKRGYLTYEASCAEEGLRILREENINLVLLDLNLPDLTGLETLKKIKEEGIETKVIIITGYAEISSAVEAIKMGASDYFPKPFKIFEIEIVIKKALENMAKEKELRYFKRKEKQEKEYFDKLICNSETMKEINEKIKKVACSFETTILIEGESGVGKEIVARAIHNLGNHNGKPFVAVNCTLLEKNLLESELFGHEPGAFTDARERKEGLLELAHGGTLLLDEIGDMPIETQAKLLRVIEDKEFMRLGGTKKIKVNVRFVVATNKDLEKLIKEGRFREDFYYRLNVVNLKIPPLRERKEDIPHLAKYFIEEFNQKLGKKVNGFTLEAEEMLKNYVFHGNVRELRNLIERIIILDSPKFIEPKHLPFSNNGDGSNLTSSDARFSISTFKNAKKEIIVNFEKEYLEKVLSRNKGNVSKSAKEANLARSVMQRLLKRHALNSKEFKN